MGLEPVFAGVIWVLLAVRRLIPAHAAVNHSGRHGLLLDLQGVFLGHGRGLGILLQPPGEGQTENIEWFKYIKVARQPDEVPMSLFSVQVKTKLHERMLAMREDQSASVRVLRQLPKAMLSITWIPISVNENEVPHKSVPRIPKIHKAWRMGPGVDIGFEPEQLKFRNAYKGSYSEEDRRQYRAAAATALTVLVYVFLQVLTERIAKARGVSFPKTDWIIALMPRFGIEAALMEVAQLIYRGRGKTYTADDGTVRDDGDWKNRRLVMLLQDFMPEGGEPEPRLWLRQVSDLLTFLVMLRAAIYTRITGDAGLDRQPLALVPVGGIGSEEMLSLMSTQQMIKCPKSSASFIRLCK